MQNPPKVSLKKVFFRPCDFPDAPGERQYDSKINIGDHILHFAALFQFYPPSKTSPPGGNISYFLRKAQRNPIGFPCIRPMPSLNILSKICRREYP